MHADLEPPLEELGLVHLAPRARAVGPDRALGLGRERARHGEAREQRVLELLDAARAALAPLWHLEDDVAQLEPHLARRVRVAREQPHLRRARENDRTNDAGTRGARACGARERRACE